MRWTVLGLLLAAAAQAELPRSIIIRAGDVDRVDCPVIIPLTGEDEARAVNYSYRVPDGNVSLPAQVCPAPFADGENPAEWQLVLVVPGLADGGVLRLSLTAAAPNRPTFTFAEPADGETELRLGERPVLRYMHHTFDPATAETYEATKKVYHHAYAPDGSVLLTKGLGGLYPHHRGIFYGFNKVTYGDVACDIWHCPNASQVHEAVEQTVLGPVLGRQRVRLAWRGPDRQPFAVEQRVLTAYATREGNLIEFASRLTSLVDGLRLDGDPQHAGFHFRAAQEVADETKGETIYIRPDGAGEPGATRNWPAQREHANLPFDAMSFVVGGRRYTCAYLDRPENPKEARFSERDYGRFGSYFEYELDTGEVLEVRYRLWIQDGEMTVDKLARKHADFVTPPEVSAEG